MRSVDNLTKHRVDIDTVLPTENIAIHKSLSHRDHISVQSFGSVSTDLSWGFTGPERKGSDHSAPSRSQSTGCVSRPAPLATLSIVDAKREKTIVRRAKVRSAKRGAYLQEQYHPPGVDTRQLNGRQCLSVTQEYM